MGTAAKCTRLKSIHLCAISDICCCILQKKKSKINKLNSYFNAFCFSQCGERTVFVATEIEATITAKFDDINQKQEINETRQGMLLRKIANLERDNVMRESYDKRLNVFVHGWKERENETADYKNFTKFF